MASTPPVTAPHIVIIGAGIAGLAAAYRLTQRAPHARLTLIESAPRLGGKIVTERVETDGGHFVIEGGPDTFLSYKPRGLGLCRELGLEARLHGTNPEIRRTYVMRNGHLYDLPEGLTGLIPSRFGPLARSALISPLGKLRMGLEYFVPARRSENGHTADESLEAFVTRRLGRELYARMIEPLLSGIYAGDGATLSLAATFPQLKQHEREYGGLIRGMLAARKKRPAPPPPSAAPGPPPQDRGRPTWPAFVTPTTGLAEIVEALDARLASVTRLLNTAVTALASAPSGTGYTLTLSDGRTLTADAVLVATPAHVSARILAAFDRTLSSALAAIPHVSTATVSLAYPLTEIPRPLDAYGYIIPKAEGHPILACTWTSTKFPHRAPAGWGLIRAFLGRAGDDHTLTDDDDALITRVRTELRTQLGITAAPHVTRVFRWPQAMPQYTLGHLERIATIDARVATHPGLALAGNAYRGIGIPDCIDSGEQAAERIATALRAD